MIILRQFFKFLNLIRQETTPNCITSGIVLGMLLGLTPTVTLHWACLFLCVILLRVNLMAVLLSTLLFLALTPLVDPLFHQLGTRILLGSATLHPLLAWLYHAPIVPFTRFTNTIVLGSMIFCTLFTLPFFFLLKFLLTRYWNRLTTLAQYSQFWTTWTSSRVYRSYMSFNENPNP